eukprot:SAG31_NODE_128_length_23532_cov_21.204754_19_plen_279_part_00
MALLAWVTATAGEYLGSPPLECFCWLRGGVDLANCDNGSTWNTWTRTRLMATGASEEQQLAIGPWVEHAGANCYVGHGATWGTNALPVGTEAGWGNFTVATCQAKCQADPKCTAITVTIPKVAPPPPPPGGIAFNPGEQIPGPNKSSTVAMWRTSMEQWRTAAKKDMNYSGAVYDVPQLTWTQTSWIQPQMHPYDRFFFDETIGPDGNYTVQKWVDDVNARYGGVDSILMWPTYTNIGTDDRSQFDLFEAMPGGIEGVKQVVNQLHDLGIKVLIPYNP